MNLVGEVGETDETHEFLSNNRGRGGVLGRGERGIRAIDVASLGKGFAVAARIVGHLSERAWGRWATGNARRGGGTTECVAGCCPVEATAQTRMFASVYVWWLKQHWGGFDYSTKIPKNIR